MPPSDSTDAVPPAEAPPSAPGKRSHIVLTSHPTRSGPQPVRIDWGAGGAQARGPVIGTVTTPQQRNVIGTHSGSYMLYRALAVAAGALSPLHKPDLTNTAPAEPIGPFAQWSDPEKIVSIDPYGHMVGDVFAGLLAQGYDIRPTIAVTRAHINMPELKDALSAGRLKPDGHIVDANGDVRTTKVALEPVWYLPGIAKRFKISETDLRRGLFEYTGGMFPELVTRSDMKVFLPPIGGMTVYLFGDVSKLGNPATKIGGRVHDECNGSDVFGSDICTCRPYLAHGIEVAIETAQQGGVGFIVYNRKEGRALGEVTKFLVYNARKRQEGGDQASTYFKRTECVAGVQDMRFQELMPDVLHWLGISRIDRFASMSNMKSEALIRSGIAIVEQVEIPPDLIPADASVEMEAKKAAGYFTGGEAPDAQKLADTKGRGLDG
jgi:GTP cyclohydrolase II